MTHERAEVVHFPTGKQNIVPGPKKAHRDCLIFSSVCDILFPLLDFGKTSTSVARTHNTVRNGLGLKTIHHFHRKEVQTTSHIYSCAMPSTTTYQLYTQNHAAVRANSCGSKSSRRLPNSRTSKRLFISTLDCCETRGTQCVEVPISVIFLILRFAYVGMHEQTCTLLRCTYLSGEQPGSSRVHICRRCPTDRRGAFWPGRMPTVYC